MKATLVLLALVGCKSEYEKAGGLVQCPPEVPPELAPPAEHSVQFAWKGEGVQRYGCNKANGTAPLAWNIIVPEASLSENGQPVGSHYAGPSWLSVDGSTAVGRKKATATIDKTAIPWLMLQVSSHNGSPGILADVTYVQRVSTTGGLAPTKPCNETNIDETVDVPYTAMYMFYKKTPGKRCGA